MRRIALVCVLAALIAPAPAHAGGRVHAIRLIAVARYGPAVCGNTMAVPITEARISPDRAAEADLEHCAIRLQVRQDWTSNYLCLVLLHEYKHLTGWRAPPGEAYVAPDGTVDDYHSRDPLDLMYPSDLSYQPFCAPFVPRAHLSL